MKNQERDEDCRYKDLCEEMYGDDENFSCNGMMKCEHYDAYLEGECVALECE